MDIPKRTGDKIVEHYGARNAYLMFKEEHKDCKITPKEFYKISEEFNTEVVRKMIYEAFKFKMPGRLSTIHIRKHKTKCKLTKYGNLDTKHLHVDYAETKRLWAEDPEAREKKKVIFHLNEDFDGFYGRFFWFKYGCVIRNRQVYAFSPCRAAQRALAAGIKTGKVDFYG